MRIPKKPCCPIGARHDVAVLEAAVLTIGTPGGMSCREIAERYGLSEATLRRHRHDCMPPVRGAPAPVQTALLPPESPAKADLSGEESKALGVIRACATLLSLGSWKADRSVRALAARFGVSEAEVERCCRVAATRVRSARGGYGAQLELSVGVLSGIRDDALQTIKTYQGIADGLLPPGRSPSDSELKKAAQVMGVVSQARSDAILAQKQIDTNTIHRKTAPLVQVSVSANPDFGRAYAVLAEAAEVLFGDSARQRLDEALGAWEDAGEQGYQEWLMQTRADRAALVVRGEARDG